MRARGWVLGGLLLGAPGARAEAPSLASFLEDLRLDFMLGAQTLLVQDKATLGPAFGLGVGVLQFNMAWNLGHTLTDTGQAALHSGSRFGHIIESHFGARVLWIGPHALDVQTGYELWLLSGVHSSVVEGAFPLVLTGELAVNPWLVVRLQARWYLSHTPGLRFDGLPVFLTLGAGIVL